MTLTEKEKAVFEEYCKEIAELEKTDKDRYEELRKAIKNFIGKIGAGDFVFIKAFNLDDKAPCDDNNIDDFRFKLTRKASVLATINGVPIPIERFELTREIIRQIEAKALRRLRHPRRCSNLRDYID